MKLWLAALALVLLAGPVSAQTYEDVVTAIETNMGDPVPVMEAIDAIQAAVADDDAEAVADWVAYPFKVTINGQAYVLDDAEAFIAHYEAMMTPEIKAAVVDQPFETLFVNASGIMFGDGQMWLAGICADDTCADFDTRIITIQSTAK